MMDFLNSPVWDKLGDVVLYAGGAVLVVLMAYGKYKKQKAEQDKPAE